MKSMSKIVALIVAVCLLCPMMAFANEPLGNQIFSDVSEADWFYSYVKNVSEKNFLEPTAEKTFEPDVPITRAAFVAAIARLSGEDVTAFNKSSFSDIKSTDWCAPYVEWAYRNGIASGTQKDVFSPDASITREQAAALIHRFLNKNEYVISTEKSNFSDAESISSYAELPVAICQNAGILTGYADSVFNPAGHITRAEAGAVITRLEEYIDNSKKERIFNAEDQRKINIAIKALNKPIKEDIELAKDVYNVAFSKSFTLTGNAHAILEKTFALQQNPQADVITKETVTLMEMAAEGLYGVTNIEGVSEKYFGKKQEVITSADFITGDIIVFESDTENEDTAVMYIYDGKQFSKLKLTANKESVEDVLKKAFLAERFVVLRPSYVMHNVNPSLPYKEEEMKDSQKAVVATAENYLLRGYRIQYADTRLAPSGEFRWKLEREPEDYTLGEWGYTNCAAFVTDVHRNAIGWKTDMFATYNLLRAEFIRKYYYKPTGKETNAERQTVEEKFYKQISPSDIIVIRRRDGSGHAMLYVGNGNIIHSSGYTYNYNTGVEVYEPSIRYLQLKDLFTPAGGERRYLFSGLITEVAIIRPINIWDANFPENSLKRIENMKGIVAEKLSSHKPGITVNPGEEMTFTFSVFNTNDYEVNLHVSDKLPSNTTYVSGAEKFDGKNLSWDIAVPAGETVEVSYIVKVNKTVDENNNNTVVSTEGKVGEVFTNCSGTKIRRTLTSPEQEKLVNAVKTFSFTSGNPIENINAIYNSAFSAKNIIPVKTPEDVAKELFAERSEKAGTYTLNTEGNMAKMVVPSLFGGRCYLTKIFEYKKQGDFARTRLVKEENLMVGDIVARYDNESSMFYLYTGNELIDLSTGEKVSDIKQCLESLLASQLYFAVIRPAAVMK